MSKYNKAIKETKAYNEYKSAMNKEDIHEAAEKWLKEKGFSDSDYMDSGMIDHIADACTYFHLHQTKKMLEGWTDERIENFMESVYDASELNDYKATIYWQQISIRRFRDELLKELEG